MKNEILKEFKRLFGNKCDKLFVILFIITTLVKTQY